MSMADDHRRDSTREFRLSLLCDDLRRFVQGHNDWLAKGTTLSLLDAATALQKERDRIVRRWD